MNNKTTFKYLEERKVLLEKFKVIHKDYPKGGYDRIVKQLREEIADISEKLYKKETK